MPSHGNTCALLLPSFLDFHRHEQSPAPCAANPILFPSIKRVALTKDLATRRANLPPSLINLRPLFVCRLSGTMEPTSSPANSSFGSTVSSSSHHDGGNDSGDRVTVKQEPREALPPIALEPSSEWRMEMLGGIVDLVGDDDIAMDEDDIVADPRHLGSAPSSVGATMSDYLHQYEGSTHQLASSATFFDHWSANDEEMASPSRQPDGLSHGPTGPTAATIPALAPMLMGTVKSEPHREPSPLPMKTSANPSFFVSFEKQSCGHPFALSKPIMRDDGLLVVGTEAAPREISDKSEHVQNCIFVTNFRAPHGSRPLQIVQTPSDVRDLQWLGDSSAVAAIGSDIHLLLLDSESSELPHRCTLSAPVRRVHSDTIRELAVSPGNRNGGVMVASGGFDETVVLTTLGEGGHAATSKMTGKIDAYDVVSSLRWHPTDPARLSWTTDGGDFQIMDVRARTKPQLQVALNTFLDIDRMGGLFSHEYTSSSNVMLGFQKGKMLFLDLRMPRKQNCYGAMDAHLAAVGEICRSTTGTCAMFGVGGFTTAPLTASGRELARLTSVRPPHSSQVGYAQYKTNGSFSRHSGFLLGVSDNLGAVSIYGTDTLSATKLPARPPAAALDNDWQERAV